MRPLLALSAVLACNARRSPAPLPDASPPVAIAEAPSAPPRPYDLPADLARLTRSARDTLGERAVVHVTADVFLLAAPGPGPSFDAAVKLLDAAVPAFAAGRFTRLPDRAITILLLSSDGAYRAFSKDRPDAPDPLPRFGYYLHGAREVVVDAAQGIHTLTHEIVHPIVARDFPAAPLWFDEGLGALFENPRMAGPGDIHGATNWRRAQLVEALTAAARRGGDGTSAAPPQRGPHQAAGSGAERVGLDALFGMSDDAFRAKDVARELRPARELLHYAMARYACEWLDAGNQLWPFYRAWREGIAGDPSGREAFRRVVLRTPEEANGEWVRWVLGGAGDSR
jgi:hypothetical protein